MPSSPRENYHNFSLTSLNQKKKNPKCHEHQAGNNRPPGNRPTSRVSFFPSCTGRAICLWCTQWRCCLIVMQGRGAYNKWTVAKQRVGLWNPHIICVPSLWCSQTFREKEKKKGVRMRRENSHCKMVTWQNIHWDIKTDVTRADYYEAGPPPNCGWEVKLTEIQLSGLHALLTSLTSIMPQHAGSMLPPTFPVKNIVKQVVSQCITLLASITVEKVLNLSNVNTAGITLTNITPVTEATHLLDYPPSLVSDQFMQKMACVLHQHEQKWNITPLPKSTTSHVTIILEDEFEDYDDIL